MPRFLPFPGVRYDERRFDLAAVTAPPYDVISADDRAELVARSPYNAVAIDLPAESDGSRRYDDAADRLRAWRASGVLVTDPEPTFTVYQMRYTDDLGSPATTLGVLGALELSRPGEGGILPHEHTTPKARSDRLELLRATRANLSAIWGLSLTDGLTDLLTLPDEPDAVWTDDDGVEQTVWIVRDPERLAAIAAAVDRQPVVIADGHHRYETALAYRDERRAAGGPDTDGSDATLCLVVELTDRQLTVRPIHRLLAGLPDSFDLVDALTGAGFRPVGSADAEEVLSGRVLARMASEEAIAVVRADGSAELLHPDADAFADVVDLDSARLAEILQGLPDHTVTFQHGTDLVSKAVGTAEAQWGVLLRPATVARIAANAAAGERMPAKTTFFHPKPKTGVVFRPLD